MKAVSHADTRLRRLRSRAALRRTFAENVIDPRRLIQPYFIVSGSAVREEVQGDSGLWQLSADQLPDEARRLADAGIGGVLLFNVPESKSDDPGRLADQLRPVLRAIDALAAVPDLVSYADVCLCSHSTHGHCGLVEGDTILNDPTLPVLGEMAAILGGAGVDFVAPSDMMDGRVAAIRAALDARALEQVGIVSYAVKMASGLYAPFRDVASSAPAFGDRATYQMPAGNRREARREWRADEAEGADALLFKPAMTNLDLIRDAREDSDLPLFAYHVSGEYMMLKAAAAAGLLNFERVMHESLLSLHRAGAGLIATYYARDWATR